MPLPLPLPFSCCSLTRHHRLLLRHLSRGHPWITIARELQARLPQLATTCCSNITRSLQTALHLSSPQALNLALLSPPACQHSTCSASLQPSTSPRDHSSKPQRASSHRSASSHSRQLTTTRCTRAQPASMILAYRHQLIITRFSSIYVAALSAARHLSL